MPSSKIIKQKKQQNYFYILKHQKIAIQITQQILNISIMRPRRTSAGPQSFPIEKVNELKFNVLSCDWKKMRLGGLFVDKSLLVIQMISNDYCLITRPRKWGKSSNLSMLKYFFNCPFDQNGKVDQVEKYKNRALFVGASNNQRICKELYQTIEFKEQLMADELARQNKPTPDYLNNLQLHHDNKDTLIPLKIAEYWEKQQLEKYYASSIVLEMNFQESHQREANSTVSVSLDFIKSLLLWYNQHEYLKNCWAQFQALRDQLRKIISQDDQNRKQIYKFESYLMFLQERLRKAHPKRNLVLMIDQLDAPYYGAITGQYDEQCKKNASNISNYMSRLLGRLSKNYILKIDKIICTGAKNTIQLAGGSCSQFLFETVFRSESTEQFYGFTEQEITTQLVQKKFKTEETQRIMEIIREQYNGFKVLHFKKPFMHQTNYKAQLIIYNPYSVCQFLSHCAKLNVIQIMKNAEHPRNLCFWVSTQPKLSLVKSYLNDMNTNSKLMILYIFQNLLGNSLSNVRSQKQQSCLFNLNMNVRTYIHENKFSKPLNDNHILKRSVQEIVYLLIQNGYLSYYKDKISIPNEELRIFFQDVFEMFLIKNLRRIERKQNSQNEQRLPIKSWQSLNAEIAKQLQQFIVIFGNFCEPLFSALMFASLLLQDISKDYIIEFEKRYSNIQPDLVLVPLNDDTVIIHEHKVFYGNSSATGIQGKLMEAIFQIFYKNYFKCVVQNETHKNVQWKSLIMRGIVAHYHEKVFTLHYIQKTFKRSQIAIISTFSSCLNKLFKKSGWIRIYHIISPRQIQIKNDGHYNTFNFFQELLSKFKPEIYQFNMNFLNKVQEKGLLIERILEDSIDQQGNRKIEFKKRPVPLSRIEAYFSWITLVDFFRLRYFGLSKIEPSEIKQLKDQLSFIITQLQLQSPQKNVEQKRLSDFQEQVIDLFQLSAKEAGLNEVKEYLKQKELY